MKLRKFLDLCSGSGGVMPAILEELQRAGYDVHATLTDLYPSFHLVPHARIAWLPEQVDATRLRPDLPGVRTMFSGFHHFRPQASNAILQDAFDRGRTLCIFEALPGTPLGVGSMFLVPIIVLAVMPFVRPFRWSYLPFTYLIPLIPFTIWWDGVVSMLRIYSPTQMRELTAALRRPDYTWECGRLAMGGASGGAPYLIGRPV